MLMKGFMLVWCSVGMQIAWPAIVAQPTPKTMLFDFRNATDLNGWSEQSDTVRSQGMSKATFDLYKARGNRSAILFTLLNPLPDGACFAGVRTATRLDLEPYAYVSFPCTAAGNATVYKIVLRHDGMDDEPHPTFEQTFKASQCSEETAVRMPISRFEPYYRGRPIIDGPTLNAKNVTEFGIQVAGGVYEDFKQSGLSSLMVDRIWAE